MERVLHVLNWETLLLYIDYFIVISPNATSQLKRLEDVFEWLEDTGLMLRPTKCELLQDKVHYLGHVVSAEGVTTDLEKVAAIRK